MADDVSGQAGPEDDVLIQTSGGVAVVSINRPERRNSLTVDTAKRVCAVLREAARDRTIKVLVFRGVGRDFCCGADIGHVATSTDEQVEERLQETEQYEVTTLLHEAPAVTVAAIRGGCAGAGLGWACACDVRVADTTAKFNTAFLDVGVAGDMGGPWLLPRIIGAGRTRDLYLFPRKFGAEEAHSIGLVSRVFEPDAFEGELDRLIRRLDGAAPLALAAMKANFLDAERMDLRGYLAVESERHGRLFKTRDTAEAFRASAEKRPAVFEGR